MVVSNKARQITTKTVTEIRNAAYDFTNDLASDELITGTPTAVDEAAVLTIDNVAVNTAAVGMKNSTVAIGKAVVMRIQGGVAGTRYTIKITAVSDAAIPQTIIRLGDIDVITDA